MYKFPQNISIDQLNFANFLFKYLPVPLSTNLLVISIKYIWHYLSVKISIRRMSKAFTVSGAMSRQTTTFPTEVLRRYGVIVKLIRFVNSLQSAHLTKWDPTGDCERLMIWNCCPVVDNPQLDRTSDIRLSQLAHLGRAIEMFFGNFSVVDCCTKFLLGHSSFIPSVGDKQIVCSLVNHVKYEIEYVSFY